MKFCGFTLIELIVVIAILGILAAIAIPRFSDVQSNAKIKADAATAKSIISSARIYEAENNLEVGKATIENVKTLMTVPKATSGTKGDFGLTYVDEANGYKVTWPVGGSYTEVTNVTVDPTLE